MRIVAVAATLFCFASPAWAGDVTVTIGLVDDGGKKVPSIAGSPPVLAPGDKLIVNCPPPAGGGNGDCTELSVMQGASTLKAKGSGPTSPWTSQPLAATDEPLTLGFGDGLSVAVTLQTAGTPDGAGGKGDAGGGRQVVRPACPGPTPASGEIYVSTLGDVLASAVGTFTEDDTLTVWVFGPADALDSARVVRRSVSRDVTVLRVQGDPSQVTGGRKESGGVQPIVCKRVQLTDFAAGRGQFALVKADGSTLAEFELAVRPVFDGMFTVGFVGTWLVGRSYSLRADGDVATVVADPASDTEGRFALMYTAFLPTSRLKLPPELDRRIGASVGVLLDDPIDNLLVGVNLGPFNGLSLTLGGHFGKVTVLDDVKVGDELPAGTTIPTRNEWQRDWYAGVSIDISVATRLFFAGFGR